MWHFKEVGYQFFLSFHSGTSQARVIYLIVILFNNAGPIQNTVNVRATAAHVMGLVGDPKSIYTRDMRQYIIVHSGQLT